MWSKCSWVMRTAFAPARASGSLNAPGSITSTAPSLSRRTHACPSLVSRIGTPSRIRDVTNIPESDEHRVCSRHGAGRAARSAHPGHAGQVDIPPIAPLILFFVPASLPDNPTTDPGASRCAPLGTQRNGRRRWRRDERGTPHGPGGPGALTGSRLAGYLCEEEIGRGGMAVVYRAYDDHLGRRVALKVLAPDLARDEVFRARFMLVFQIAAATEHPNIIPVYAAGEADGVLYIAMRYVPDGDVRTLIDRVGPLPAARACALIAQAASALDAAHARGLVHRDVKPTNMLLEISPRTSRPDHLYLSDFGLAKPSAAATGLTATGQFFGTVDYVAPEQIQGDPLDGRTDQYALACAAFEMLSGSPPFRRENGMAVISAQLSDPPPSLSARVPGLPAAADQVIAKALAKSPAGRYDRCSDFAEALLAACLPGATGAGAGLSGIPYSPTRAAMPMTPATVADAGGAGPAQPPSATPGYPAAGAGHPAAGAGYPPAGTGYPAAGAGFPPPPPAGFPPQPPIRTGFPPPAEPDPATLRWSGQPDPGYGGRRGGRDRRRSRGAFTAGLVAALLVLFFAAAGVTYLVLHKTHGTGPDAAGSGAAAGSSAPSTPASP